VVTVHELALRQFWIEEFHDSSRMCYRAFRLLIGVTEDFDG
jgi:hypothetical protein